MGKLKKFAQPKSKVIRNGAAVEEIKEELVVGDQMIVVEGNTIDADAKIIQSNNFLGSYIFCTCLDLKYSISGSIGNSLLQPL